MAAYLARRVVASLIVIFGIALLTFVMLHAIAPTPGRAVLGQRASPAAVNSFNRMHGYDRPLWDQFISYIGQLLHFNLGYSYKLNQTVDSLLKENVARSAWLSGISLLLSVVIAVPLGIYQAIKRNSLSDQVLTTATFTAYAIPDNFLGIVIIGVLAVNLGWFPAEAPQSESIWPYITDVHATFLPILTLTVTTIAGYSRYMRSSALDALAQDYMRLARAKGLPEWSIIRRHLFRNASLAMITLIGLSIPALLGGNLIVEVLFNSHGLGLLFLNELDNEDYPTVIALVLIGGVLTVIGNFVADLALSVADPRIRIA
jgi:peptide/nickel transport system permease protein